MYTVMEIRKDAGKPSVGDEASQPVEGTAEVYNLEEYILKQTNADVIAMALIMHARKNKNADSFSSAVSMLNFYINRAGVYMPDSQRQLLEHVKLKLREYYRHHDI